MGTNKPKQKKLRLNAIEKALVVLMEFTRSDRELGTIELSKELGLHFTTVSRILQTLKKKGFLQNNGKGRKFILGPSAFELGRSIFRSLNGNLLHIAMPYLMDLSQEVGESVLLLTMSGRDLIVTYIAQGRNSFSVNLNIGDKVPVNVSPGAKVILAFSDEEVVKTLLDKEMHRFTPHTITDKKVIIEQLHRIRELGIAFNQEEMILGVCSLGAPIFDHRGKPIAAVDIVGLASRIQCNPDSPVVAALKKTARDISSQLFHRPSIDATQLPLDPESVSPVESA